MAQNDSSKFDLLFFKRIMHSFLRGTSKIVPRRNVVHFLIFCYKALSSFPFPFFMFTVPVSNKIC
jgi:hypothetical protein